MNLLINEPQTINEQTVEVMERAAGICLQGEGLDPGNIEISLSFVSEEEIQSLNRQFRGVDAVTDVLSFPLIEDLEELVVIDEDEDKDAQSLALGDVVICLKRAQQQAEQFGHSRERELVYLFVHSVLHLLGYDHMEEEDKRQMRAREEEVMTQVNLSRDEVKQEERSDG